MTKEKKIDVWMPLYIGNYLADTTRLNTEQHGAYLLLMMDYWRSGPPPDDDAVLANIVKATGAIWKKIRPAIVVFFQIADGKWTHQGIEKALADARSNKKKAVEKAKTAAEERWGKQAASDASSNATSNATSNAQSIPKSMLDDMHNECPLPLSVPLNSKAKSRAERALATRLPADWRPSDEEIAFCRGQRSDLDPAVVAARFRDYWVAQPGVKGRKVDWPATWRNWVRNERAQTQARASPQPYESAKDRARRETNEALTGKRHEQHQTVIDIIDIN